MRVEILTDVDGMKAGSIHHLRDAYGDALIRQGVARSYIPVQEIVETVVNVKPAEPVSFETTSIDDTDVLETDTED